MSEQADENLERLQTAFPGLVWSMRFGIYIGSTTALADGVPAFAIQVGARNGVLSHAHTWGSAAGPLGGGPLGSAPLSNIGRVIATEAKRILAEAAALEVTGKVLRRAATGPREWAASVLDKEYGLTTGKTRHEAIDEAVEGLLEDVDLGNEEAGTFDVEVHEDPEWCEKAQQFCDDHDHTEHARWMDQVGVTIEVEVYYLDPSDEDGELGWREVTGE